MSVFTLIYHDCLHVSQIAEEVLFLLLYTRYLFIFTSLNTPTVIKPSMCKVYKIHAISLMDTHIGLPRFFMACSPNATFSS